MSFNTLNGRMARSCLLDETCSKAALEACTVLQMEMVVKKHLLTGENVAEICVHRSTAAVVQDPLSS